MVPELTVRKATVDDVARILPHLRQVDREEALAMGWPSVEAGLRASVEASRDTVRLALINGEPLALFGIGPQPGSVGRIGVPWLVGTAKIDRNPRLFLRASRKYLKRLSGGFDLLVNQVAAANTPAIRWLQWLGFSLDTPVSLGPYRTPFCRFHLQVGCRPCA
ncbi:MAG: hypothetical protein HQL59_09300 [Magnetococcales bacterium]|nr:hypothetical protein [Magnetococcales bacterium]